MRAKRRLVFERLENRRLLSTIDVRVAASSDDAEESPSGSVNLTSSDLELTQDKSNQQIVGMRFAGLNIPPEATIQNAYIQFQVEETGSNSTSLTIHGQAINSAPTFTSASRNVSSRIKTSASVPWSPAPWTTVGQAGPAQQTPNIAEVIQEIVNRPGWSSGNSLAIIVSGTGTRTAESFNGLPTAAPLLHVEYVTVTGGASHPPIDIRVMVDVPYSTSEFAPLQADLANVAATDKFFVHLGDIKSGSVAGAESVYTSVENTLLTSSKPVFIVPGDNEWNDCSNPDQAWSYWDAHLMRLDENWSYSFTVLRQSVREENFSFVHSGVLFIGINLVGGRVHDSSEWSQRMTDDANWVNQNFNYFGSQVTSAVVFGHAFPDPTGGDRQQFGQAFVTAAQNFGKPVLHMMGDAHSWVLDHPYNNAPNVTRVVVDNGVPSVRVTISDDPANPFTFDRSPLMLQSSSASEEDESINWAALLPQLDVSGDGEVTALDALQVINYLNAGSLDIDRITQLDVNQDGTVSALDTLLVINYLNAVSVPQGEGRALIAPAVDEPVSQRKPDAVQIRQMTSLQNDDRHEFQQPITQQTITPHDPDALRSRTIQELMDETPIDVDLDDVLAADIMTNTVGR